MKMRSILSRLIVVYAAGMFLAVSCSQASNKPPEETSMAIVSVRYIVDDVHAAIEFDTRLTGLASVRHISDDARATVNSHTPYLVFTDPAPVPVGITPGRARALVAVAVGLISLVFAGLALARSAGRAGYGKGRAGAIVALVLGLIGIGLSVAHLGSSTGGFGTGGGRGGAHGAPGGGLDGVE